MPDLDSMTTPRVLVLSGGGGNGAAQAAAVLELYRRGLEPDLIIGTSIGAWNGAYLAAHPGVTGAEALVELWQQGAFFQMSRPRGVQLAKAAVLKAPSLISRTSIKRALFRTGLDRVRWEDLQIPFVAGAIDASNFELRYWDSNTATGSVGPQVTSSSALTPLLPFGVVDGRTYVDAGMQDNYGIPEVVKRLSATGVSNATLIVIDCAPSTPQGAAANVARATDVALGATFRRHRQDGVAMAQAAGHRVEIIEVGGNHAISDYMDPEDGFAVGRDAVRAWAGHLPYYPSWPQASFLRRVSNLISFTVIDLADRAGIHRRADRGIA